jgi:hypothetical protein
MLVIKSGRRGKSLAACSGRLERRAMMMELFERKYDGTFVNVGSMDPETLVREAETRRDSDNPLRRYTDAVSKVDGANTRLRGIKFAMLDNIDAVTP